MSKEAEDRGRASSVEGFAHEHIAVGLLMMRYQNVSLVDLPLSTYDMIIARKLSDGSEQIIRAQVKTARKSVSFTGGSRGGQDRTYKSDVKTYNQSPATSDVIIGLNPLENGAFDMYFIPTILITIWNTKSKSINQIAPLRNNFDILEHCKEQDYVIQRCKELGVIK